MSAEPGNLPPHANPCCGYVTDASGELGDSELEVPSVGDLSICFNCGAVLVYADPDRNVTRFARRVEIETLPHKQRQQIAAAQRFIRKLGFIPREARRVRGN